MRIKKLNTPIFFTTTTKFGVSLIQSAPKKCFFRYDLVWVKSAPAGFLCAKKMPMRKHEMIYVFYEKLPFYDLSRHTHKFIKQYQEEPMEKSLYGTMPKTGKDKESHSKQYDPPLPVSVIKKVERKSTYGNIKTHDIKTGKNNAVPRYDPPLPVSVVKEEVYCEYKQQGSQGVNYDPPLPVSVVKEEEKQGEPPLPVSVVKEEDKYSNGTISSKIYDIPNKDKGGMYRSVAGQYDPPLPVSVVKEDKHTLYGEVKELGIPHTSTYDPPLPVSVVKEVKEGGACKNYKAERLYYYDENGNKLDGYQGKGEKYNKYDPPLPDSMLEIKSTRGKHSTEKPVKLMEWVLSYYSKEGDIILDPTMGSGSTGVACKNLNRKFIGIEMDAEIFEVAKSRNPDEPVMKNQ
tara:strand:- start:4409 stop:5614 length:1206 start_codon:yes stop_codon:yes gene_type:complete